MKNPLPGLFALTVLGGMSMPAWASDDDIFQLTLFCRRPASTSYYVSPLVTAAPCCPQPQPTCNTCQQAPVAVAAPACNTCAQPSCSTNYVQKSYYQAVTSYQTTTYYEPVTQYQTSYYYEPVTSYRTSYYYCPETCSYKQTCTPETAYQLRSKSCPVQGYVARSAQVPVTTYQKSYYLEPQTTCCQTTVGAPVGVGAPPPQPPQISVTPGAPAPAGVPPVIDLQRTPPAPSAPSYSSPQPPLNGMSWQPAAPAPAQQASPAPVQTTPAKQPTVRLDRIVFGSDSTVEGQIVRGDNTPRPNARMLFVNANQSTLRETISANDAGRFMVSLAAGGWLVYIYDADNHAVFHSRIEVNDGQSASRIILVNR